LWQGLANINAVDLHPAGYSESWALAVWGNQQVGHGFSPAGKHALLWNGSSESMVDLTPDFVWAGANDVYDGIQVGYGRGVPPEKFGSICH